MSTVEDGWIRTGNLRFFLDYKAKLVRVQIRTVLPGFMPVWHTVGTVDSPEASEEAYGNLISLDDQLETALSWFWLDVGKVREEG